MLSPACLAVALGALAVSLPEADLERALAILEELDATAISVEYRDADLETVLEDLSGRLPVALRADWEALGRLGVDPRDDVSLRLAAAPASMVVAAIAVQLGDEMERPTFEVHAGHVVLTTVPATAAMCLTGVYDVRDLLGLEGLVEDLRRRSPLAEAPPGADAVAAGPAAAEGEVRTGRGADDAPGEPRVLTPAEELMTLIAEHVDPEAWLEFGGARARLGEHGGAVVVTAPPTLHRKFRDVLRGLRRAHPTSLRVEAVIADVPRPMLERLARRHDPSTAAFARALLHSPECAVRWRTSAPVALDRELSVEAEGEGLRIEIELRPRLYRTTGILTIELAAATREEGDERSVRTTVSLPSRHGAAVVELPPARLAEIVRVAVLLPERG